MKTETLKKANELESRLNQLLFQRKEIQQIFDRHNQTKEQGNDFERKINRLSVVFYGDILTSYLSEIDQLKEQLAELQDEPECTTPCCQKECCSISKELSALNFEIHNLLKKYESENPGQIIDSISMTSFENGLNSFRVKVECNLRK